MIERVHIQLLRVMSGYTVRGAFTHDRTWPDESHDVAVYHGWITPYDLDDDQVVLEHLSEELYNLAPRFRGPLAATPPAAAALLPHQEVRHAG